MSNHENGRSTRRRRARSDQIPCDLSPAVPALARRCLATDLAGINGAHCDGCHVPFAPGEICYLGFTPTGRFWLTGQCCASELEVVVGGCPYPCALKVKQPGFWLRMV